MGIKVIWRGEAVRRSAQPGWKRALKRAVLGTLFGSCDALLYSCSGNKEYLEAFGIPESRMFPIPCAVDNDFFRSEHERLVPQRQAIRYSLGIDSNDFVVLFCARFTLRKRPMDLIRALVAIDDKGIVALFVGDGPERAQLEEAARQSGIRAVFSGFKNQSEVGQYYCIADVACVISEHDPSPKAMNEAMNFGLPVVVTDVVGTAQDLVRDHDNGFIIQVGELDQFANRLRRLRRDPQLV